MNILEAYDVLHSHTYFTKPIKDKDGNIFTFDVSFQDAVYIFPYTSDIGDIVWGVEFGHFSLEGDVYFIDADNYFTASSYEEACIMLAEKIVNAYGNDKYDDYFTVNDYISPKDWISSINNGKEVSIGEWDIDGLIAKLKSYQEWRKL